MTRPYSITLDVSQCDVRDDEGDILAVSKLRISLPTPWRTICVDDIRTSLEAFGLERTVVDAGIDAMYAKQRHVDLCKLILDE